MILEAKFITTWQVAWVKNEEVKGALMMQDLM